MAMGISVVIIAKNEEENIRDCILSVKFANEIIVIDDFSNDATVIIAKELGASVFQRAMNGNYAEQYNFALEKVAFDWVLILDCDERITLELAKEIQGVVQETEPVGYEITNINIIMGNTVQYGDWGGKPQLRLFPKGSVYLEGLVHSRYVHTLSVKQLKAKCLHFPYPTWEKYFEKFNRYTMLSAEEKYNSGKKTRFIIDILLRPFFAFIKMYFLKSGWRDGKIGFVLAVYHYFYTMTKYVKLYYRQ